MTHERRCATTKETEHDDPANHRAGARRRPRRAWRGYRVRDPRCADLSAVRRVSRTFRGSVADRSTARAVLRIHGDGLYTVDWPAGSVHGRARSGCAQRLGRVTDRTGHLRSRRYADLRGPERVHRPGHGPSARDARSAQRHPPVHQVGREHPASRGCARAARTGLLPGTLRKTRARGRGRTLGHPRGHRIGRTRPAAAVHTARPGSAGAARCRRVARRRTQSHDHGRRRRAGRRSRGARPRAQRSGRAICNHTWRF